ncbi:MAG: radical SAM protein [Bdellovibrionaceae bacterium]|nr:radical SAM protein [Pseudobdellovibrionaceae bacterium]
MNSKPKCILPWTSLTLNPTGDIRQCISTKFSLGSVADGSSIGSIWSSPKMASLRDSLSNGDLPNSCHICKERERSGLLSRRELYNQTYGFGEDLFSKVFIEQNPPDIYFLDIALSDKCNMWCRMCCAEFSTTWRHWEKSLSPEFQVGGQYPKSQATPPNMNDKILDALPYMSNLRKICFKGGEPFIDDQLDPILEALISRGLAKKTKLSFVTNASVIPQSTFALLKKFSRVALSYSIDGTDEIHRYIRGKAYPLPKIRENILKFRQLPGLKEEPVLPTIQPYNLFNLGDLYQWCRDLQTRPTFYQVLVTPLFLHLKVLPENLREQARISLQHLKSSIMDKDPVNSGFIDRILFCLDPSSDYENVEANRAEHFRAFVKYTKEIDFLRGESVLDYIPEFQSLGVF